MICDNCGKQGARIRRVARTYSKGKDILVIENVPVIRLRRRPRVLPVDECAKRRPIFLG
jgi:YgiT-type zinc finger domain-containing protein